MVKAVVSTVWILLMVSALFAQRAVPPNPAFQSTSVRSHKTVGAPRTLGFQPDGQFTATNETLQLLIGEAYAHPQPLSGVQIVGGPSWLNSDGFDISAKASGNPSPSDRQSMLRELLTDRFKLIAHGETRSVPVYSLVMATKAGKPGPRLRQSGAACSTPPTIRDGAAATAAPLSGPAAACMVTFGAGQVTATGLTMPQLAGTALSRLVNRVVVDRTGLMGGYDSTLAWTPDPAPSSQTAAIESQTLEQTRPSLAAALRNQLGLKLDAQRAPVLVLVIDRVQRPAEN